MSKKSIDANVTYRHISIPISDGTINGFALWYKSEQEAKNSIKRFHDYLDAKGGITRFLDICFDKDSINTYKLSILINIGEKIYSTIITGIDSSYVEYIKKTLEEYPYYFITSGYTLSTGEDILLPLNPYNFIRSEIKIDGNKITGTPKKKWPTHVFQFGAQLSLEKS